MPKQKENTKKQCIGCWFSLRNSEGILMISFITKPFIPPSIACWGSIFKQCGFSQPTSSTLQHNGSIYFWLIPYMSWFRYFFKLFNFHVVYVRIPNMVSKYSTRWEVNKYLCLVVSWYNSVSWIKVHSRWTAVSLYLDELLIQKCQVNSEVISKCRVLASTSFPRRVHATLTNPAWTTHLLRNIFANSDVECIVRAKNTSVKPDRKW